MTHAARRRPGALLTITDMIVCAFLLEYPPEVGPERDTVCFAVSPAYGFLAACEAHRCVVQWLGQADYIEISDAHGASWPFYRDTVKAVITWNLECTDSPSLSRRTD